MKKSFFAILIPVFLAACQTQNTIQQTQTSSSASSVSTNATKEYTNAGYGIALSYPSAWTIEEKQNNEQGLAVYFVSPAASHIGSNLPRIAINAVHVGDIPASVTMDMIEQNALAQTYVSNPSMKFIERRDTTIAGMPARIVVNSHIDSAGNTGKQIAAIFHSHERLYIMMLLTLDNNAEDAQKEFDAMLASLQIQ